MNVLTGIRAGLYDCIDTFYLKSDKRLIGRTRSLRLVPTHRLRKGVRPSYGEWCYVIGIFQVLLSIHLPKRADNHILDIGCGTGVLAIASEPFVEGEGRYTGIDILAKNIGLCQRHYSGPNHSFVHLAASNPHYAPSQGTPRVRWPVSDESQDLVTALSVWTHLGEEDAVFYFREVSRVLRHGGRALVTLFLLDDEYRCGLANRSVRQSKFHGSSQSSWIFDCRCDGSEDWFHPKWARPAEKAVAITRRGLEKLVGVSNLRQLAFYPGTWREQPGVHFQDVLVFEKCGATGT